MEDKLEKILIEISNWVWGLPLIILLIGTGIFLTILLKGIQFKKLSFALYLAFIRRREKGAKGDISHFQALMTALAATVGTGNIAGVATAIAAGGPGALFWMWITALFGMATKYAEAVLAVKYRIEDEKGQMSGGPMYYLSIGLKRKELGFLFALFASIAAFGIGNMVQANSVADAMKDTFKLPTYITGIILSIITALVILGGIKSIGKFTAALVPIMILVYMSGSILILVLNFKALPAAIILIMKSAFTPTAAVGGFAGASISQAIRYGVARGIFSNESGLGSSPIAAAAAQTSHPSAQALVSMTQTFIDTIIVCSMTGLVIIVTKAWHTNLSGSPLSSYAFNAGLPNLGNYIVAIGLILFAYSTILGWSYYGEKSIEYLLGYKAILPYRIIWCAVVFFGSIAKLDLVWHLADIMNGLMAFPNLIGLIGLSPIIFYETKNYLQLKNSTEN